MLAMVESDQDFLDFSHAMRCEGSIYIHRCKKRPPAHFHLPGLTAVAADVTTLPTRACAGGVQISFCAVKSPSRWQRSTAMKR